MPCRRVIVSVTSIVMLTSACASFTPRQENRIEEARQAARSVVTSQAYAQIISQLDRSGAIVWSSQAGPDEKFASGFPAERRDDPAAYLLDRFSEDPVYATNQIEPWVKWWWPFSKTTATTAPCTHTPDEMKTKLNVHKVDRDVPSLANTLIHERVHTFCQIHGSEQTRAANKCDAAYVMGDAAESLLRASTVLPDDEKESDAGKALCPALVEALNKSGAVRR